MIQRINLTPIVNDIRMDIETRLETLGLFYRIFARGKTANSINHKMSLKKGVYGGNKKMQDIVGIRIVLYFVDDVDVVYDFMKQSNNYIDESNSEKDIKELDKDLDDELKRKIGILADKLFMPQRLNLVFRMTEEQTNNLKMALDGFDAMDLIDNTYEVQIRTIFSEGWHEVEHDLRYKCKDDSMWNYCKEESRALNGIYASLETTEASMRSMFDNIAYKNFKHHDWAAMLRNKLCIRFEDNELSEEISSLLSRNDSKIGKEIYKFRRVDIFSLLRSLPGRMPRKMDNIVFLINRATIKDKNIISLEPVPISDLLEKMRV